MAQSALVDVVRGEADVSQAAAPCSHGVTTRELLELSGNRDVMSAASLERWPLEAGLAETNGEPGLLVPTMRAFVLSEGLDFLG